MALVLTDLTTGRVIAPQGTMARGIGRAIGLLSRCRLEESEALIIPRCNAIHTWFMRFPIDVIFLRYDTVVKIAPRIGSFRVVGARGAHTVIELPAGAAERIGLHVGNQLSWS